MSCLFWSPGSRLGWWAAWDGEVWSEWTSLLIDYGGFRLGVPTDGVPLAK